MVYVPAESIGTNFLPLGSQFAPEEPDCILVLCAETRHLEFAGSNTTMVKIPEGLFMLERQRGHTQDHLQDRLQKTIPLCVR